VVEIKTKRFLLRDFEYADLRAYRHLRRDPKFQRFYSDEDSSEDNSEKLLNLFIEQANETPRTKFQLAILSDDQVLMGSCGVRMEYMGNYSIGCELGRLWHGSGAAKEAGSAILEFGFSELCAERIYAETISENAAAVKLCLSIGMKLEMECKNDQTFRGRSWNTSVFSILRDEWIGT
jgi:[ribosomal protein S5]-alanine N-acetyltransferase